MADRRRNRRVDRLQRLEQERAELVAARHAEAEAAMAAARRPGAALVPDRDVDQYYGAQELMLELARDAARDAARAADPYEFGVPHWGAATHHLHDVRELSEDDPRAPTPAGFRGELYLPQQTMLAAMLALENTPELAAWRDSCSLVGDRGRGAGPALRVQTAAARIAAQFSFGKTVLALALVCAQRVPANSSLAGAFANSPLAGAFANSSLAGAFASLMPMVGPGVAGPSGRCLPEATLLFDAFLPITVVAAAANVISQWEANAAQFTGLRALTVENVHGLRLFENLYRTGRLGEYDLLFVKAGRVTNSFVVAGAPGAAPVAPGAGVPGAGAPVAPGAAPAPAARAAPRGNRSMFGALAQVLEGAQVARLIIDDYDTLKLSSDDCFIAARFTWLVSATRRTTQAHAEVHNEGPAPADFFAANGPEHLPVLAAAHDDVLNGCCSLRCAPAYVGAHISSLQVGFRRIVVRGGQAAGILRDLDLAPEVVEMVNADAVGTAAAALGIAAQSVGDIVQRVVGDHLGRLRAAVRAQERCARVRAGIGLATRSGRPLLDRAAAVGTAGASAAGASAAGAAAGGSEFLSEEPQVKLAFEPAVPHTDYDPRTVSGLKKALREGSEAQFVAVWNSPMAPESYFEGAVLELEAAAAEAVAKYGKALARMRDNIREGYCQVCTVPFDSKSDSNHSSKSEPTSDANAADANAAYVLVGCCQIIVCETCVTKTVGGRRRFIDRCPNCAVDVRAGAGLIRVGAELNLEAALGDDALSAAGDDAAGAGAGAVDAVPAGAALADALPAEIANPKLRALVQLIRQEPIDCIHDTPVAPFVRGLLTGLRSVPLADGEPRRVLVFTMHAESTRLIEFALGVAQVPFGVLRGARAQKDAAVEALREAPAGGVLLVTSAKDCAGIHMPWLTHIVFYHRVHDAHVEAQVAARGQRLGRTQDLSIVLIANEGEAYRRE